MKMELFPKNFTILYNRISLASSRLFDKECQPISFNMAVTLSVLSYLLLTHLAALRGTIITYSQIVDVTDCNVLQDDLTQLHSSMSRRRGGN